MHRWLSLAGGCGGAALLVGLVGVVKAYDEAGHFYTTIALEHFATPPAVGSNLDEEVLIGFCAQVPDLTKELDAITVFENAMMSTRGALGWSFGKCWGDDVHHMVTVHHLLHGLTDSDAERVTNAAVSLLTTLRRGDAPRNPINVCATGLAVHLLGDSFAHRRMSLETKMYGPGMGHFRDGTVPDHVDYSDGTRDRSPLWATYRHALDGALHLLVQPASWSTLDALARAHLTGPTPANTAQKEATKNTTKIDLTQYDKGAMIRALEGTLGGATIWTEYSPRLESFDDKLLKSKSFDEVFSQYKPRGYSNSLTYAAVWRAYVRAATDTFSAQGIPPQCDPDQVP